MARAFRLAALVSILLILSCGDDPTSPPPVDRTDPPAALRLTAPDSAVEGQAFPLTLEALDSGGEVDHAWSGTITLRASSGTLSPASVNVDNGVASVQATLSGAAGELVLSADVGGQGGSTAVSAEVDLLVLSNDAPARLVVEPSGFLLTGAGEELELRVRAYDAAGQPTALPAGLAWRSLRPAVIEVESPGGGGAGSASNGVAVARAATGSGSAQVVAEAGGLTSSPALGLVARPVSGAVLVADAQVVSGVEAVDLDAPFVPGWQYRVRVRGVSADVGQLVIGTGEAPLAGRVVDVTPDGSETELTLELVALSDLFERLQIDETLPLVDEAELSVGGLGLGPAGTAPSGANPAGARDSGRRPGLSPLAEFTVGPFTCEASGSVPGLELGSPDYDITPNLQLRFVYDGGLRELSVAGDLQATFEYKPRLKVVFSGDVECKRVIRTLVVPVGGFLSLIVGAQVPVGVGIDLDAKLQVAEVGFDVEAEASVSVELGMVCSESGGACTSMSTSDADADIDFRFVSPDPTEQFKLELGAHGYGFATLTLGSPLKKEWQWEAFHAQGGLEQTVDLATAQKQAEDTAYASGFWLVSKLDAGPGKDLTTAAEWLEARLGVQLDLSPITYQQWDTLAHSPRGTFEITPETVAPGDSTELGEMATFKATLDPVTYLGAETVDRVEFFWWKEAEDENGEGNGGDGTGGPTLEPGRPSCTEVDASAGQTEFQCETDFTDEHEGVQTFYAFTHAELFGVTLPVPLEVAKDGKAALTVSDVECGVPPEWFQPSIVDESGLWGAGDDDPEYYRIDGPEVDYLAVSGGGWTTGYPGSWSPDVRIAGVATDYIRIIPLAPTEPAIANYVTVVARGQGRAEVNVTEEGCCGRYGDADAELSAGSTWLARGVSVAAGGSWSGDLTHTDVDEMDEVTYRIVGLPSSADDWEEMRTTIHGRLRHRGGGRSAEGSAHITVTILDVLDAAGNSVPVLICSAAGINYGVQVAGSSPAGTSVVASRPIRQAASQRP